MSEESKSEGCLTPIVILPSNVLLVKLTGFLRVEKTFFYLEILFVFIERSTNWYNRNKSFIFVFFNELTRINSEERKEIG